MSEVFIQRYSPKSISEFNIDNAQIFSNKNINILISGPRGSGKTSLLMMFIKTNLGEDVNLYAHEDILFLNNMKDQGIQYCRTHIKMFCQRPSKKPKIIAIDDIDEFSDVSQQVICNSLYKFTHDVVCLATCNNTLKVFDGLKSRMIYVALSPPTYELLRKLCLIVIEEEQLNLDKMDNCLVQTIVESANKSYKVLLNTLQKIQIYREKVSMDNVAELITAINFKIFDTYFDLACSGDLQGAINVLVDISQSGISVIDILFEVFAYVKDTNNMLDNKTKFVAIKLISKYITIFNYHHEDMIELAFFTNDLMIEISKV
tara:strand:+ start:244 stop:1194 length:951 start_codon:yes stop_codon:yes gene_type:complete